METLLKIMIDESDPILPFGYIKVDEVFMESAIKFGHFTPHVYVLCDLLQASIDFSFITASDIKSSKGQFPSYELSVVCPAQGILGMLLSEYLNSHFHQLFLVSLPMSK